MDIRQFIISNVENILYFVINYGAGIAIGFIAAAIAMKLLKKNKEEENRKV